MSVSLKDWMPGFNDMVRHAMSVSKSFEDIPAEWGIEREWHTRERASYLRKKAWNETPAGREAAAREKAGYDAQIARLDAIVAEH